ncbi:MAG: hypothetical protein ACTHN4_07285 [Sphingomicrobium sp.]
MKRGQLADLLLPWAGLAVGIVAAALVHQFGSEGTFNSCKPVSPIPLILVALVGMAVTIAAGIASSRVLRGEGETPARKLVATISIGSAALFVFSMIFPVVAALVIPPCFQ